MSGADDAWKELGRLLAEAGLQPTRERIARDRARLQQMRPDEWDGAADPRAVDAERTPKKQENQ